MSRIILWDRLPGDVPNLVPNPYESVPSTRESVPSPVPEPFGTLPTHRGCGCPECRGSAPTDSPLTTRPFDAETNVKCADYHAHQNSHRREGNGWTCDACNPQLKERNRP